MGFASGSVSFKRFSVVGEQPAAIDGAVLDKLAEHALKPTEMGIPEEVEYGWSGGRHVLDDQFGFDTNVYAESLFFGLRVDTNKVPGDLKKGISDHGRDGGGVEKSVWIYQQSAKKRGEGNSSAEGGG